MEQEESRKVRNRDIPLLTKIFYILKEAESVERRGEWTYERLFNITRRMTGMPIGGGNAPGMDGTLAEVEELNRIYGERLQECVHASKAEIMRELNMTEWKFNQARQKIEEAESMGKVAWRERFCLVEPSKKN